MNPRPKLTLLCGPPGSGKSSLAHAMCQLADQKNEASIIYINQDSQGKDGHVELFTKALLKFQPIIVDRMNFNKEQRNRYLSVAKAYEYETEIIVLHVPFEECLVRCTLRKDHETIKDEATAKKALNMFFSKYERVEDSESDKVTRRYPEGKKEPAVIVDLDGTLCNIDHRLHHVRTEGKKNWKTFSEGLSQDTPNAWCADLVSLIHNSRNTLVYCSGRSEEYRDKTIAWLKQHNLYWQCVENNNVGIPIAEHLYMRPNGDYRTDWIIKETILDFELLTKFDIVFAIDDRQQVVDLWRRRGITALQCSPGDF